MQERISRLLSDSAVATMESRAEDPRWRIDHVGNTFVKRLDEVQHDRLVSARSKIVLCEEQGLFPKMLNEPVVDNGAYVYTYQLVPGRLLDLSSQREACASQFIVGLSQLFLGVWNNGLIHIDAGWHNIIVVDTKDLRSENLHPLVFIDLDSVFPLDIYREVYGERLLKDWLNDYCTILFELWTKLDFSDLITKIRKENITLSELQLEAGATTDSAQEIVGERAQIARAVAKILGLHRHVSQVLIDLITKGLDRDHNFTLEDLEKIANQEVD